MLEYIEWEDFRTGIDKVDCVACIGAGKRLQRLIQFFSELSISDKIKYIADNNPTKQGTVVHLKERNLTVCSVPSLRAVLQPGTIIIITPLFCDEIVSQLENISEFSRLSMYSYTQLMGVYYEHIAMSKKVPKTFKLSERMLIPKTIHYCWFGKKPIPDQYRKWMESWQKYCPDYKIVEWNENNYDITKNKYIEQAYAKKMWAFVTDYARLDILYQNGGVYLDTDVELIRNLDDLLFQKGFVGFETDRYIASGLGIGAVAGNSMIKGMLDMYSDRVFIDETGQMDMTTCPVIQTEYLLRQGLQLNGEYQILKGEITVLPEKVLTGKGDMTRSIKLAPYTFAIHHYSGSWLKQSL